MCAPSRASFTELLQVILMKMSRLNSSAVETSGSSGRTLRRAAPTLDSSRGLLRLSELSVGQKTTGKPWTETVAPLGHISSSLR